MTVLNVFLDDQHVGVLEQDASGDPIFTYLPGARPISISLPVREEPYREGECAFFEGVLPEEGQRQALERATHVSRSDVQGLLDLLGGDVAGAVRLLPVGETPGRSLPTVVPAPLSDEELDDVLRRLPFRPMLVGEGELRLSLAGAQTKLPVCVTDDGAVRLPAPGEPTTHIVKPAIPSYPGTTENEAFVMRLASEMGLPAAKVEARRVFTDRGLPTYLLVERYDRVRQNGRVVRLHQEDFCQALGLTSAYKYENHLGPGLARCRTLLLDHSEKPGADTRDFIDAVMFNLLVGNGDAHAKNFSFLYTPKGIRLAPLYDLLSTVYYPGLSMGMAMAIDGRFRFADIDRQALESGAKAIGLNRTFLTKRLDLLRVNLPGAANRAAKGLMGQGLDDAVLERLERLVCERADRYMP